MIQSTSGSPEREMDIQVRFGSQETLQGQITSQLLDRIESGQLEPGDQLPTTRSLAVKLGVNFNTVARAYRQLDRLGLISTQPGRGTFVIDPHSGDTPSQSRSQRIEELTRSYLSQAAYLGFSPREIQDSLERIVRTESKTGKD